MAARRRIRQRDVSSAAVDKRLLPQNTLIDTNQELSSAFTLVNGGSVTITSTISTPDDARLGALPYFLCFFQGSISAETIIPGGSSISGDDYNQMGPNAIPDVSVNGVRLGTNGNNIVFKTRLTNTSGGNQTLIYLTNTRVLVTRGGSA